MITTEGTRVAKRYTDLQKCNSCHYSNNFLIEVKSEGSKYYMITTCPRCHSYDECKEIPSRIAQDYITPQK